MTDSVRLNGFGFVPDGSLLVKLRCTIDKGNFYIAASAAKEDVGFEQGVAWVDGLSRELARKNVPHVYQKVKVGSRKDIDTILFHLVNDAACIRPASNSNVRRTLLLYDKSFNVARVGLEFAASSVSIFLEEEIGHAPEIFMFMWKLSNGLVDVGITHGHEEYPMGYPNRIGRISFPFRMRSTGENR